MARITLFALALLFIGCSSKQCGVDEKLFASFTKEQQAKVCAAYVRHQRELELLRVKRDLIKEQNRKLALQLELKKVACLYQPSDTPYAATQRVVVRIVSGKVGKEDVIPMEFSLARKEARRVCLTPSTCLYVAYWGADIYFDIWPQKEYARYVLEGAPFLKKGGLKLAPRNWFKAEERTVSFHHYKKPVILHLVIRYF